MWPWCSSECLVIPAKKRNATCSKFINKAGRYYGAASASGQSSTFSNFTAISCWRRSRGSAKMEINRKGESLEIADLDPFLAELLRQIPESANSAGASEAEARLYTQPSTETEMCAEWKTYVEPELRRLFRSATETVADDLAQ